MHDDDERTPAEEADQRESKEDGLDRGAAEQTPPPPGGGKPGSGGGNAADKAR